MAVNISGLRRNIKNVACSYSPAQIKVREATSNDPWGPSSSMMSEVADLTYNIAAFSDVMQMIWKRLNDVGKNWRHVYKALVLLEYLLKTGCDKVIEESKMNMFIVKSLVDFQYLDDNKDQGINVREKAKSLVSLLKNEELLKSERVKALKAKFNTTREKHHANRWIRNSQSMIETSLSQLEDDRPQTKGEEDLQIELALAMSRGELENCSEEKTLPQNYRYLNAFKDSNIIHVPIDSSEEEFKFVSRKSEDDIQGLSCEDNTGVKENPQSSLFDLVDLEFPPPAPISQPSASQALQPNFPNPISPPPSTLGAKKSFSLDPLCMSTPNLSVFDKSRGQDPWGGNHCSPPPPPTRFESTNDVFNAPDEIVGGAAAVAPSSTSTTGAGTGVNFDPWEPSFGRHQGNSSTSTNIASNKLMMEDPFSSNSQHILANFDNIRQDIESSSISGEDPGNDPFVVQLDPSLTSPSTTELNAFAGFGTEGESALSMKPGVGSILNEHQNLVDLDNWSPFGGKNPFELKSTNPFQPAKQSTPMNKLVNDNKPQVDAFHFPQQPQQQFMPQQQQQQHHQFMPPPQQQQQQPSSCPEDNLFFGI